MDKMYELKEMLCDELEKITNKGELSASSLDAIEKLTHSIKSIETIIAMNEYSEDDGNAYDSYMRGGNRGGNSNARGGRGGRSPRYGRNRSYRGSYDGMGYSGEEEMEDLKMNLREMLEDAQSEDERKMIRKWISQVNNK